MVAKVARSQRYMNIETSQMHRLYLVATVASLQKYIYINLDAATNIECIRS